MVQSNKILITGAAGFVGTALCRKLHHQGFVLRAVVRRHGSQLPAELLKVLDDIVEVGDFTDKPAWENILLGVDRVVHLAARAHTGGQSAAADLYFRDNLDITVTLAQAAIRARVKKFIFISTIKVNGEGVLKSDHRPYKISDKPRPEGAYAVSKWRAEQELGALFSHSDAPGLVILRPPMIYGGAAKGNSAVLQKWLSWGLPLPVPKAGNRRSLLSRENLIKIIVDILSEPERAHRQTELLLPCDRDDWSTKRLAVYLARKASRRERILPIPGYLLQSLVAVIRHENFFGKIFGSLRIEKN